MMAAEHIEEEQLILTCLHVWFEKFLFTVGQADS